MKLRKLNRVQESLDLDVGLSDDLEDYADAVSDKSGTEVVKKNNVVRNLDYMNQKGGEIRKDVEVYDNQVAKQVKDSVKGMVESLKRKYLNLVESECRGSNKQMENQQFKFKPNKHVKSPVFEETKFPKRKKIVSK